MRRTVSLFLGLALTAGPAAAQQPQQPQQQQAQPAVAKTHLKVGDTAPDFALKDDQGKTVKLSKFRGKKNVVLAFYVLAFTGG
jgi:cytochrome oxidase Cu insertion factor (SCO1/SenC/PrrC family)